MPFLPQRMRRPCLLVRCRSTLWASQARILGVLLARPLLLADTTTHGTSQCSQPGHARVAGATRTGASHGAHEPSAFSRPSRRPVAVSTTHSTKPACGDRAFSVNPAFSTPPILKICASYQDKGSLLSSVLVSTRRPPTCSPAPLCHVEFRTRARCGVILGSIPIAVCDLGPLVGLFLPTSQRKSHFRPPSPLRACERLGSMSRTKNWG